MLLALVMELLELMYNYYDNFKIFNCYDEGSFFFNFKILNF